MCAYIGERKCVHLHGQSLGILCMLPQHILKVLSLKELKCLEFVSVMPSFQQGSIEL